MMKVVRSSSNYQNFSEKFLLTSDDVAENCFHQQYFYLYHERTKILRPRIIDAAKKYGNDIQPTSLIDVQKKVQSFVIGVIVKRIKQRPSVLKSIAAHELILPEPVMNEYTLGSEDYVELEDGDQHVRLTGAISMEDVATGCVLGVIGVLIRADVFEVQNIVWPTMVPQPPFPHLKDDKYIMFISGIAVTGESKKEGENLFYLDLLEKWLCGYLPASEKERMVIKNICRVVIAGESIGITGQVLF
uniref:DNA_pol_D_N domain-containing protein n=1 Tax=Syphacia muris TaxID=451379 RepID=A0A0N5ABR8_9BILA